jgi:type II secretory ATPase GspE/PulE/Tfp pilus assembly ATPase PilB-like protein
LLVGQTHRQLAALDATNAHYATQFVDSLLAAARQAGVSDVHLQPTAEGLDVRWRLDGVLQSLGIYSRGEAADVVARLKVLADLLTYRNDVPQEGRIRRPAKGTQREGVEMRVSTFPTLHGERAVVRIFAPSSQLLYVEDLGLPEEITSQLMRLIGETSGALIVAGPAGSGKTTTIYAALRELVRWSAGGKSIVSLEDPIEVALPGVAQSQVNRAAGFDLAIGLRSIMRQDPEVIAVGEIRDRETAETAFQASLTGHLLLTTFHAGSAAAALSRLSDMGIEPYLLRSGILAILCQRLLRRLCDCAVEITDASEMLGLPFGGARSPAGCDKCLSTGYTGRILIAEMLTLGADEVAAAVLARDDAKSLAQAARRSGMTTLWSRAVEAVRRGETSPAEVRRVLGFASSEEGEPA